MKLHKNLSNSLQLFFGIALSIHCNVAFGQNIFESGDVKLIEEVTKLVSPAEVNKFLSNKNWIMSDEKVGPKLLYFKNGEKGLTVNFKDFDQRGYRSGLRVMNVIIHDEDYDNFSKSMKDYGFYISSTTYSDDGKEISVTSWKKNGVDMYFMYLYKSRTVVLLKNEPKIVSFDD